MESRISVFKKRKMTFTAVFLCVAALFVGASLITAYDPVAGIASIPKAISWIAEKLVPNEKSLQRLPNILSKLYETAFLSIAVTLTSGICAFFFALLGSKTTRLNGIVSRIVRIVAAFFRNVPDVVWAMLLMFSFGQNVLTGFLALFFYTFGLLTRTFIETIDEVSSACVEALTATGASFMQIVFQGIIPSAVAEIITWLLYMIETNIRSSTLIGILTATGIGYLFDLYFKRLDYASASLVVIAIVVLVIIIETISNKIRKVIL
ncbi:phosphonate transport system permease protein [Sporobacter termitidis DSM 10068]|uniref:Phosphonate transport system permease protein n=1 Tax=Sporobacter termitidis DSM 10068 TaxID=1123282 RepID=A0A1M5Z7I1_9FIRM|nr:ABC transporter permease subunit [Sporobacter termitidis]SHI20190.1 phosphonate transport system permease protein [Sporobacter termitidis DSM 10068]